MSNLIRNTFSKHKFIQYNKIIANCFGVYEAIIIGELISKRDYLEREEMVEPGDWFWYTKDILLNNTGIKDHRYQKAINNLCDIKFIERKRIGVPPKMHFKILDENIERFLSYPYKDVCGKHLYDKCLKICHINVLFNNKKRNNKNTSFINKRSISVSEETQNISKKNKGRMPISNKGLYDILKLVNEEGNFDHSFPKTLKDPALKTLSKCEKYLKAILKNNLSRIMDIDSDYLLKNKIDFSFQEDIKTYEDLIPILRKSVKRYKKMREEGYYPENKSWTPKNILSFFYNFKTRKSWFLYCLFNRPKKLSESIQEKNSISIKKNLPTDILVFCSNYFMMNYPDTSSYTYWSKIKALHGWFVENKDKLHSYNGGNWTGTCGKFERLLDRIKEFSETFSNWSIGNFGYNNPTWKYFLKYIKEKYDLDLSPRKKDLEQHESFIRRNK